MLFLYIFTVGVLPEVYFYSGSFFFLSEFPLQLRASQAHAIWSFFFSFLRVQLCNYFHCALPVESASKLHVSRCGKYMTFGGASLRENNADCAMPGQVAIFFYFFLFVCVLLGFVFFFWQNRSRSRHPTLLNTFRRRAEQPLTTCGGEAPFI